MTMTSVTAARSHGVQSTPLSTRGAGTPPPAEAPSSTGTGPASAWPAVPRTRTAIVVARAAARLVMRFIVNLRSEKGCDDRPVGTQSWSSRALERI